MDLIIRNAITQEFGEVASLSVEAYRQYAHFKYIKLAARDSNN